GDAVNNGTGAEVQAQVLSANEVCHALRVVGAATLACMRCVAIRQVAFEDLGIWEPELVANGYRVEYLDAGIDPLDDAVAADLVVVLGGPIGVGDVADYPVIAAEIEVVRQRLEADAPTVGVCLGAQIMAAAAGARVHPGAWELGWAP